MIKFKILIKRAFNNKNAFLTSMILTISFVCILSASYAFFTASAERKGVLNIVSGNLYSLITSPDISDEKSITINSGRTRTIKVKLTNVNGIEAKFNFYYSTTNDYIDIGYTTDGDVAPTKEGKVLQKNGDEGDTKTLSIYIKNKAKESVTITFGSEVGLANQELNFPSGKHTLEYIEPNPTIKGLPYVNKNTQYDDNSNDKHGMYEIKHPDSSIGYRYTGDDPYNYVTFNDETWRIIGVFNEPNAEGKSEQRIKIIKDTVMDKNTVWDGSNSNNWNRPAGIQAVLKNHLNSNAQSQAENMTWYIGAKGSTGSTADDYYTIERGSVEAGAGGGTTGSALVGLIYPSDYLYTYQGDSSWATRGVTEWTIMPFSTSANSVVVIMGGKSFGGIQPWVAEGARPVVYLKSDIDIIGGTGEKDNPYVLGKDIVKKANDKNVEYQQGSNESHQMYEIEHPDSSIGYRYTGDDPYNYVTFNDETWRIIGVFNEPNAEGKSEQRIKIIKDTVMDKNTVWDGSNSNNWNRPASIQAVLKNHLNSDAQNQAENMKWYLGAKGNTGSTADDYYTIERSSTEAGSGGGTTGSALVGLIYPSDYLYTYQGDSSWATRGVTEWTIMPYSNSANSTVVIMGGKSFGGIQPWVAEGARPVVYLKSSIKITGGDGSEGNHYTLSE